jgi:hypothetical protein
VLKDAERTEFALGGEPAHAWSAVKLPSLRWPTEITQEMVSVALLKPDRMSTIALFQYIRHLEANSQTSQRYEIEFWRKVFYPLSCMVMVVLALPFAYLHFRSGGITSYVFGGVLIGISFFLLNNVFGYIGNLQNWLPWLAAGAPGLIYTCCRWRLRLAGAAGADDARDRPVRARLARPAVALPMETVATRCARCSRTRAGALRLPGTGQPDLARPPASWWRRRARASPSCRCSWAPAGTPARTCPPWCARCSSGTPASLRVASPSAKTPGAGSHRKDCDGIRCAA